MWDKHHATDWAAHRVPGSLYSPVVHMGVLGDVEQDTIMTCACVFCQSSSNRSVIWNCVSYFVHLLPALTGGLQGTCSVGRGLVVWEMGVSYILKY